MSRMLTGGRALLLLLILFNGCDPSESFYDGGSVRLYYAADKIPCQGSARYLGGIATAVASYLGVPQPRSPIAYHYDPSKVSQHCPEPFGCYVNATGEIWSDSASSAHEIVHAAVGASLHDIVPFFNEGIAVALGGEDVGDIPDYSRPEMDLITTFGYSTVEYATAGDFVSSLLSEHGPTAFVSFLQQIQTAQAFSEIDAAFSSTYGQTIAQAISARVSSSTRLADNRLWFPECVAAPAMPASPVATMLPLACDNEGIGPDASGDIFRLASFDTSAGGYLLDVESDPRVGIGFHRCASSDGFVTIFGVPGSTTSGHGIVAMMLDADRYAVTDSMQRISASPTAAMFSVALSPSMSVSDTCGNLPATSVDASVSPLYAAPEPGKTVLFAFQPTQPIHRTASGAGATIDLCSASCMTSGCPQVMPSTATLDPSSVYTLVVQGTGSDALAGLRVAP